MCSTNAWVFSNYHYHIYLLADQRAWFPNLCWDLRKIKRNKNPKFYENLICRWKDVSWISRCLIHLPSQSFTNPDVAVCTVLEHYEVSVGTHNTGWIIIIFVTDNIIWYWWSTIFKRQYYWILVICSIWDTMSLDIGDWLYIREFVMFSHLL